MLYQPYHLVNIDGSLCEQKKLEAVQVFQLARTNSVFFKVRALGLKVTQCHFQEVVDILKKYHTT